MGFGARIALIVVLILIIGFFVLVVLPNPNPISNGGNLPPDPSLPGYIKAVQTASSKFAATTASLTSLVGGLASDVSTTFGSYDSGQGVSDGAPKILRKDVEGAIDTAQGALKSFAQEAAAFDKTVQGWTASTNPYKIMQEKPTADGLKYDVMKPMGNFLDTQGQLTTLVSTWNAAYEAASEGNQCTHNTDCKKGQACSDDGCAAYMNRTMQGAINALSSAAGTLGADGALGSSPWEQQANDVYREYMALFNHLAGL